MPPPVLDEDFDGLDEVIDEMTQPSGSAQAASPTAPASKAASALKSQESKGKEALEGTSDFPDPDDEALDADLARELEEQMQGFLKNLDGGEADMLAKLMQDFMPPEEQTNRSTSSSSAAAADTTPASKKPVDFQSSVASTLEKMRQSEQSAGKPASAGDDPAALLSSLLGGLGSDLPEGDEEGLQAMLDQMMSQLMSKDLLYEPLKEMRDKYPAYLKDNKANLSQDEFDMYEKQRVVIDKIVSLFEDDSVAEDDRNARVADLVKEMNDCGAPPAELMGDMPEGLDLGPDGMPKMLNECPTS